jgi:ribonuclease E
MPSSPHGAAKPQTAATLNTNCADSPDRTSQTRPRRRTGRSRRSRLQDGGDCPSFLIISRARTAVRATPTTGAPHEQRQPPPRRRLGRGLPPALPRHRRRHGRGEGDRRGDPRRSDRAWRARLGHPLRRRRRAHSAADPDRQPDRRPARHPARTAAAVLHPPRHRAALRRRQAPARGRPDRGRRHHRARRRQPDRLRAPRGAGRDASQARPAASADHAPFHRARGKRAPRRART